MPNRPDEETGSFSADIPEDAITEALRAVERGSKGHSKAHTGRAHASGKGTAAMPPASEPGLAVEVDPRAAPGEASRDELLARVKRLEAQFDEEHERLLRVAADADNARKRWMKERDEIQRYGVEKLAKELLPALDALDRALATAAKDDPLVKGVEMTRRLCEDALGRFGVKGFSAKGSTFDPRVHEALMTFATEDAPPGTVLEEQQRGFTIPDRLLRPASVVVAAAPRADGARPLDPGQLDGARGAADVPPTLSSAGGEGGPSDPA